MEEAWKLTLAVLVVAKEEDQLWVGYSILCIQLEEDLEFFWE